ncbi:MAG: hypothetical protein Q8K92_16835 [Leadbetterella sp.]|nr:hypothetical protein [Leadbetterella sp.]
MSNNQENQKLNHERFHLEIFSSLKRLPGEELSRQNTSQKPDFLFQNGESIIGIEHTEIKRIRSSEKIPSLAELKGIHRGIVRKAGQLAAEQGLPPLNVQVNFHDYYYRFKLKGDQAVQGLLDTVRKNLDRIMNAESFNSIKIDPPNPFVGISLVYVTPGTANGKVWLNHHRWEVMEPGFVSIGFIPELQAAITKKNKKKNKYLRRCDRCWLLIVADRTKADQKFEFTPEMQEYVYESEFEKTFYLEIAQRFITELDTKMPNE